MASINAKLSMIIKVNKKMGIILPTWELIKTKDKTNNAKRTLSLIEAFNMTIINISRYLKLSYPQQFFNP